MTAKPIGLTLGVTKAIVKKFYNRCNNDSYYENCKNMPQRVKLIDILTIAYLDSYYTVIYIYLKIANCFDSWCDNHLSTMTLTVL